MASIETPTGRTAFLHLFEPWAGGRGGAPGQEPKYGATLLFDPVAQRTPEYKKLKEAVQAAAIEKWGVKVKDPQFAKSLRWPFRDAGERSQYEGFEEGFVFINPTSKTRPGVVDARREYITVADDCWSGQLARFLVAPWAYDTNGNKGVTLFLDGVQITKRDMPRLDGRIPAHKAFGEVDEDAETPF